MISVVHTFNCDAEGCTGFAITNPIVLGHSTIHYSGLTGLPDDWFWVDVTAGRDSNSRSYVACGVEHLGAVLREIVVKDRQANNSLPLWEENLRVSVLLGRSLRK